MLTEPLRISRALLLLALLPLAASAEDLSQTRTRFAATLALTRAGVAQTAEIESFHDYPLYPYLQAARLQRLVADAPIALTDEQVAAFLDANRGELWSRDLRRAWLSSLADRNAWAQFAQYYDESVADPILRCQFLTAKVQTLAPDAPTNELRALVFSRWMTADDQPSQCDAAFSWLKDQGALTDDAIEQRARLALKSGRAKLARALAASLPPERADPIDRWASLIQAPGPELQKLIDNPKAPADQEAMADAFARLARIDGAAALKLYKPLLKKRSIDKKRHDDYARALAVGLAMDRQPEAVAQYKDVPDKLLEDKDHEWRLRATLWAGNWKQFLKWHEHAPAALKAQSRWRYWQARALDETGKHDEAKKLYENLLEENGYHSVLAAQRLGQSFTPRNQPGADDPEVQVKLTQVAGFQRAREAAAIGEYAWSNPEWRAGMEGLSAPERLQAARLAANWGLFDQTVTITAQQQMFDDLDLLYPQPYQQIVRDASALSGLPTELIYSVMRQESLFRPDAVSSANAIGLLQLLPRYAREAAKHWNLPQPAPEDLKKPQVNVPLGAAHLREYLDSCGGRVIFALACYNAGPGPLKKWLPDEPRDAEIWMENIPYNETRTYVQRILWNGVVYAWKATGQPQNLVSQLTPVEKVPVGGS